MSPWWLLIIVPACVLAGVVVAAMFGARSYDRGWHHGWQRGWDAREAVQKMAADVAAARSVQLDEAREAAESITRRKT